MKKRSKIINWGLVIILMMLCIFSNGFSLKTLAAKETQLILDGKNVTSIAAPIIQDNKVLVPIKFIAEKLGAKVDWNEKDNILKIENGDDSSLLRTDSYLVIYQNEKKSCGLSDVPPRSINDVIYISTDLCRNVLGVGVEFDENNNIIHIDSNKKEDIEPFYDVRISSIESGQAIKGKTD